MLLPAAVALALSTAQDPAVSVYSSTVVDTSVQAAASPSAPVRWNAAVDVQAQDAPAKASEAPAAAATTSPRHAPGDPLESMNRRFYRLNDSFDRKYFGPTARYYKHKTPSAFQRLLHNFVTNFSEPVVIANDALQLRPKRTMISAFRFAVNSTVGVVGLFDVAKHAGAERHDNDFGITLGRYGVPSGPYLYVPFMGPSNVRDAFGAAVDGFLIDPLGWVGYEKVLEKAHPPRHLTAYFHHEDEILHRDIIRAGEAGLGAIDMRARVDDDLNAMMATATDPYATIRSVYLQDRAAQIDQARWRHKMVPDFDTPADTPDKGHAAASTAINTKDANRPTDPTPTSGARLTEPLRFLPLNN